MRASAILVGGRFGLAWLAEQEPDSLPPIDSPAWDELERHARAQTLRMARTSALAIVVLIFVTWPVDLLTVRRDAAEQAVFTAWRLSIAAIFSAMYLTMSRLRAARRHPATAATLFAVAGCASLAYFLSQRGGLERPYFAMMVTSLIAPAAVPAHAPARLGFLLAISAGMLAGFFGAHPEHLDDLKLGEAMIHMLSVFIASAVIGHAVYINFCQRFFQRLTIERTADELARLNRELGERVREKTADLRRLAEHLQVVQEDERGRLARELHDELGQRLSAMRYVLLHTARRYERAPTSIAPRLQELDVMVDGTLEATRAIVSGLRPPLLDQLGLPAAIEWLAQRTAERASLRCVLDLDEGEVLDGAASLAAYRVLQESLTNVVRHAGAGRVEVTLRLRGEALTLEVTDDGRGFPSADERPFEGNGILGMRERARALGGELLTAAGPSGGACVRLRLPLGAGARGAEA